MFSISLVTGSLIAASKTKRAHHFGQPARNERAENLQNPSAPPRNETRRGAQWSATTADACRFVSDASAVAAVLSNFPRCNPALHARARADGVGGGGRSFSRCSFACPRLCSCWRSYTARRSRRCRSADTPAAITPPMSLASYDDGFRLSSSCRGEGCAFPDMFGRF